MQKVLIIGGSGLVGGAIHQSLRHSYKVVITAGHHAPEGGWRLAVEEPESLLTILNMEEPDIVVSSVRGDFQAQRDFHEKLADWIAGKEKKLLYISTGNVFDGDLSRPWTENDPPAPESEYGIFKRECEVMLQKKLQGQLIIFRLSFVWSGECPRLRILEESSRNKEPVHTYKGYAINVTLAEQIGWYAKYVLEHDFTGIFHVGTVDTVDHFDFQKKLCEALNIQPPEFELDDLQDRVCQAFISARRDIPAKLQLTVEQVVQSMQKSYGCNGG